MSKVFKAQLDENDRMPFGKHEGERMGDIPEQYLAWLRAQPWIDKHIALSNYLEDLDLPDYDPDQR